MNVNTFLASTCNKRTESINMYLLPTEFDIIESDANNHTNQEVKMDTVVRFLNPKTNINSLIESTELVYLTDIGNDFDDFDSIVSQLDNIKKEEEIIDVNICHLYFLPSHMESVIKNITSNHQRKKIDSKLMKYIPDYLSKKLNLEFVDKPIKSIDNINRGQVSTSLFKFYMNSDLPSSLSETQAALKKLKYDLNARYIGSFERYAIGNINEGIGLLEKSTSPKSDDPLSFHYDFWKLKDSKDFIELTKDFNIFSFMWIIELKGASSMNYGGLKNNYLKKMFNNHLDYNVTNLIDISEPIFSIINHMDRVYLCYVLQDRSILTKENIMASIKEIYISETTYNDILNMFDETISISAALLKGTNKFRIGKVGNKIFPAKQVTKIIEIENKIPKDYVILNESIPNRINLIIERKKIENRANIFSKYIMNDVNEIELNREYENTVLLHSNTKIYDTYHYEQVGDIKWTSK